MRRSQTPREAGSIRCSWVRFDASGDRAKARLYRPIGQVQNLVVKLYETCGRVGPGGVLTLHHLPFLNGDEVKVRVESAAETATPRAAFVFGLHTGLVTVSDDFDAAFLGQFNDGATRDAV